MTNETNAPLFPRAEVEHRLPGRMRLRIAAKRGDAGFFRHAEERLAATPGVTRVRGNPLTGGILVEYDGSEEALLASARDQRLFSAALPPHPAPASRGGAREPRGRSGSPLDLAALGLAGTGLLQIARGRAVGSASENLWNAYGLYAVTRQALPAVLLAGFGVVQILRGEVLGSAVSLFLYAYSAHRMTRGQPTGTTI